MIVNSNKKFFNKKYLSVITKALNNAIEILQIPTSDLEMDINFVSEKEIKSLNKDFRNNDSITDVLSFPALLELGDNFNIIANSLTLENYAMDINPDTNNIMIGSICICKRVVYKHAREYNNTKMREIVYMSVHGFLHLLGFDHMNEDDKKIMREKEEKIMSSVNLRRKS